MKPEKSQKPKRPRPQAGKADSPLTAPATVISEGIEGMLLWADTLNKLTDTGASPFTEVK